ncbi:hypothetical protein [Methylobacterium sp. CM6244]
MKTIILAAIGLSAVAFQAQAAGIHTAAPITIRTEVFGRPPYSGATYYIYQQNSKVICTKLATCNKYNDCETKYVEGEYKDPEDADDGAPFGTTPATVIPHAALVKHACLTSFNLVDAR